MSKPTEKQIRDTLDSVATAAVGDPGERGRDLRQVTPFAGVLDPRRRADVYRSFQAAA